MCEPVTIAATCLAVVNHIWILSDKIRNFVLLVREARADMLGLTSELSTLSLSISMLQDDCTKIPFPESVLGDLSANLEGVLKKCEDTSKEMIEVLDFYMSDESLPKLRWVVSGRDRINKLKNNIESCKPAIGFALMVGQIVLLKSIKNDTAAIRDDTAAMKKDTTLIPSLKDDTTTIIKMLSDKLSLSEQMTGKQFVMQRFYDEMTTTAESVVDEMDAVVGIHELQPMEVPDVPQSEVGQNQELPEKQGSEVGDAEDKVDEAKDTDAESLISSSFNSVIMLQEQNNELDDEELEKAEKRSLVDGSESGASENGGPSVVFEDGEKMESPELKPEEDFPDHSAYREAPQLPELSLDDIEPLDGFSNFWETNYDNDFTSVPLTQQEQMANKTQALESNASETPTLHENGISAANLTHEERHMNPDTQHGTVAAPTLSVSNIQLADRNVENVHSNSQSPQKPNSDETESTELRLPPDPTRGNKLLSDSDEESVVAPTVLSTSVVVESSEYPQSTYNNLIEMLLSGTAATSGEPDPETQFRPLLDAGASLYFSSPDALLVGIDGILEVEVRRLGRPQIVKFLLSCGAKANSHPTIIETAIIHGNVEVANLLLENGAVYPKLSDKVLVEIVQNSDREKLWTTFLLEKSSFSDEVRNESVCKAVKAGYTRLLDDLLTKFGTVNAEDQNGNDLCVQAARTRKVDVMKIIIKHRPDKSTAALRVASIVGSTEIVELLLDYGFDINAKSTRDWTALHCACKGNNLEVVRVLLGRGAKPSCKLKDLGTPLQMAQSYREDLLKNSSCKIDDETPNSPFSKCEEIIQLLKEAEKTKKKRFWSRS